MPASPCKVHVFPGQKCSRLLSIGCSFQLSGHRRTIIEELHEEEQVLVLGLRDTRKENSGRPTKKELSLEEKFNEELQIKKDIIEGK